MGKKREYKEPTCPYCGTSGPYLQYSHLEACYRAESFKLLKKILKILENGNI